MNRKVKKPQKHSNYEFKLGDENIGYDLDRLNAHNPREVAMAIAWKKENLNWNIVNKLIPNATFRDQKVSATIIQWLGTNVGMCFLETALKSALQNEAVVKRLLWR